MLKKFKKEKNLVAIMVFVSLNTYTVIKWSEDPIGPISKFLKLKDPMRLQKVIIFTTVPPKIFQKVVEVNFLLAKLNDKKLTIVRHVWAPPA